MHCISQSHAFKRHIHCAEISCLNANSPSHDKKANSNVHLGTALGLKPCVSGGGAGGGAGSWASPGLLVRYSLGPVDNAMPKYTARNTPTHILHHKTHTKRHTRNIPQQILHTAKQMSGY